MTTEYENPFANYGNTVNGSHFIGRQKDLKVIESRITRPHEGGNLAIIGEPGIGKSSLVWKAVMDRREELIAKRLVPVWMNIANFNNAPILFRTLVTECYDKLEDLEWLTEAIDRAKERTLQDELSWTEGYGKIQRFFEKVRQADIRIVFILDEFDHARIGL
ncbi:MAG: ATP-binding protein [Gammaproteobacteria bacterium]|nr:ATP-binding protein [Gammaproteobacteria bacterium]